MSERAQRWLVTGAMGAWGALLLAAGWRRWADLLVDFSRELYTAWRISEGAVLYRDIAWFNGPLSAYWNALWFWLLGPGFLNLVFVNLGIAMALAVLLYYLLASISSRLAGAMGVFCYLGVFFAGHLTDTGNYNFVAPYSHELTHGLALSLLSIWFLHRFSLTNAPGWAFGCGLALGLVFLTKAEVFLAALLAVAAGWIVWTRRQASFPWNSSAWLGAGFALGPVAAFCLLATALPWSDALRGACAAWSAVFRSDVLSLPFYQYGMGTAAPLLNLHRMAVAALVMVAAGGMIVFVSTRSAWPTAIRAAGIAGVVIASFLLLAEGGVMHAGRPLPLLAAGFGILWRRTWTPARAAWIAFSFFLLLKIFLNARLWHYGFALALPATMLVAVALFHELPSLVERLGGSRQLALRAGAAMWAIFVASHVVHSSFQHAKLRHPVGDGSDQILTDGRGTVVNAALREIATRVAPGQTLAVLPEGIMINYLSRRIAPTPYMSFLPGDMKIFGESAMTNALRERSPDWILLVDRDSSEYGPRRFGEDYALKIGELLRTSYRPCSTLGAEPMRGKGFGATLYEKR